MAIVTSYGIALVKKNKLKNNHNQYEILMIKKRLTYSYIAFVKGIYNKNNDNELLRLFDSMTVDEKFCIMSLNFNIMWYKSTLTLPYINKYMSKELTKYEKCKIKFENTFLNDNGKRLLNLLKRSKSSKKIWEIPKGSNNKNESNINAAIREFYEETNIKKNKYKILYHLPPITYTFTDENITYKYIYYLAILLDNKYNLNLEFKLNSNIMEITELQFLSIKDLEVININSKLINIIKNIFKITKPYFIH
jgi:8-oxo-dGTP pyrophosphatase MutT (NUDIX family)